jgi:hypothetical protein
MLEHQLDHGLRVDAHGRFIFKNLFAKNRLKK